MKFKKGDKVRCIDADDSSNFLKKDHVYQVEYCGNYSIRLKETGAITWGNDRFVYEPTIKPSSVSEVLKQDAPGQGVKGDAGKPDLSLLSTIWIFGVADVLTYGKVKRGAHNWRKGLAITRLCAGSLRHIFQFLGGEDIDRDDNCEGCQNFDKTGEHCTKHSNKHHLDCASCNLMFARELLVTRPDLDDRYKPSKEASNG